MQKKLKIVLTSLNKSKKSAHCLRCVGHAPVGLSKRGRDTESDAVIRLEEIHPFFSTNVPSTFPSEIDRMIFLLILLITSNGTVRFMRQSRFYRCS